MRLFALLNFQDVVAYFFVGLLFLVLFGLALSYAHFNHPDDERRKREIAFRYRQDLADRHAPYPLFMVVIIAGVVVWGFLYILLHGLMGVKI